jgi:hypothetical protein
MCAGSKKPCSKCKISGLNMAKRRRSRVSGLPFDATGIAATVVGAVIAGAIVPKITYLADKPKLAAAIQIVGGAFLSGRGGLMAGLGAGMVAHGGYALARTVVPDMVPAVAGLRGAAYPSQVARLRGAAMPDAVAGGGNLVVS